MPGLDGGEESAMTKAFEDVIDEVRRLPPDQQRDAAEMLVSFLEQQRSPIGLSQSQIREVERRLAEPDRIVPDEEMAAFFAKLGG
jgi:hypothetical protein